MSALPSVSSALADPVVRRRLAAQIRRRVGPSEAEDVAQSVLCEAIGAAPPALPPADVPRWLSGIARHEVCDAHRRRARAARLAERAAGDPAVLPSAPSSPEHHALLRAVVDDARTHDDGRVLEWIVREHDGERLQDIAEEVGVPAATLRKRISRFRRRVRDRWLVGLSVLAVLGLFVATAARQDEHAMIVREPAAVTARAALERAQGTFRVVASEADPGSDPAAVAAARIELQDLRVTVRGRQVHVRSLGFQAGYTLVPEASGELSLRRGSRVIAVVTVLDDGGLLVRSEAGPLRGRLSLARIR